MQKLFSHILCLTLALTMVSCLDNKQKEETVTYSEALITSMTFAASDSFPGLAKARFTITTSTDTGMIYNIDSLQFGTLLDTVSPRLTFNHTPAYTVFYTGADSTADTVLYTGADTLNFTVQPVRLLVMASDNETPKWYNIYVNVHTVDPDLYQWECIQPRIFSADGAESKALLTGGRFYLFVNNGFTTSLYTSADAITWNAPQQVSTLPEGCSVRKILEAEGVFYYPAGNKLYTSVDGLNWTAESYDGQGFSLVNMLYFFNDSVWAIAERTDGKLQLCNMHKGGHMALTGVELPDNFPVSEYAALPFASASNRKRAMIVGGFDRQGNSLNSRWNIEYLKGKGYSMADFTIEQPAFESLSGAAIVVYDNALHMFGSVSHDNTISSSDQLISTDEGMHWTMPDTAKNVLPADYRNRQKASVLVDENTHFIYIIGGQSRTESFADVYRGRLNKLTFRENN